MFELDKLINKAKKRQDVNLYSYLNLGSIKINTTNERERMKKEMLENVISIMQVSVKNSLEVVRRRYELLEKAYNSLENYKFKKVEARLSYRGLVGVSESFGKLVFDVGLSWDPILQLPFFPGSSVKGATRSIAEAVANGKESIGKDLNKEDVTRIFGPRPESEGKAMGSVIFHDAYPIKPNKDGLLLEPDVMTPIYKDDIEEHRASPTPICYLTVARGVVFEFLLASKDDKDLDKAVECLKKAMEYGIGAKTLIGYSTLKLVTEPSNPPQG